MWCLMGCCLSLGEVKIDKINFGAHVLTLCLKFLIGIVIGKICKDIWRGLISCLIYGRSEKSRQ